MGVLICLIVLSLVMASFWFLVFTWAVESGQFADLDGPGEDILIDDEELSLRRE